ncbi:MAG TPA: DUF3795 domain-containing protein [Anaerolineaceae bacterium]|nr:DUF3795 domain-containing protein [Anaerolineaceae bacterium]
MEPILSRCGYRCDLCLAFEPNVRAHPENQQKLSDGWFRYFGFRIQPEDILCDGCMSENPRLIDAGCPVRPCVIAKEFFNCSQCEDYGCTKLVDRWVILEDILSKNSGAIPTDDYECFILPYENKIRLDELRGQRSH